MDETCRVTRGASPRPIIDWIAPSGIPWIKIGDASSAASRTITRTREFIRPEGARHSVRVVPGDLIVSNSATPGIPKFVGIPACIHDGWLLLREFRGVLPEFLYYRVLLDRNSLIQQGNGSVFTNLKTDILKAHLIDLPPIEEQRGIAATLGALDDKIESNRRSRTRMRQLGSARLQATTADNAVKVRLADVTVSIARGVAPRYADDDPDAALVLNQRCIRDGWIDASPARRMVAVKVSPARCATDGDVLVNSTGTGTLGRVGRWHSGDVFVDGHVTVVKADRGTVGPTVLAYTMFQRQPDIEGMATGSTGQTELSPARLSELELELPSRGEMPAIEGALHEIEERIASLMHEESVLVELRDSLIPELLSGRIRVSEAGEAVVEAVA